MTPLPVKAPASNAYTHALVIGIGWYDWLEGGDKKPTFGVDHLGQLTCAPISARQFANWLLNDYNNPATPLASLDLLISDKTTSTFTAGGQDTQISRASFANIASAVDAWFKRGVNADDVLLFFFVGHGAAKGPHTSLLCDDYGSSPQALLGTVIDFTGLRWGMDQAVARRQCYFIDACRKANAEQLLRDGNGQSILDKKLKPNPSARIAPVFQSTQMGQAAYSVKDQATFFTQGLLKAVKGVGATDEWDGGNWWIGTNRLGAGLPSVVTGVAKKNKMSVPPPTADIGADLMFHKLKELPTEIPVKVCCAPEALTGTSVLSYSDAMGVKAERKPPEPLPWEVELSVGSYTFEAQPAPAGKGKKQVEIQPNPRTIHIPMA